MPSAARNISIEVCSSSLPVTFRCFFLLLVAAAPVRLLLAQHPLLFLLPPFILPRSVFRFFVASSLALITSALPAFIVDTCFPCSHLLCARLLCCSFVFYLPSPRAVPFLRPAYPLRTSASPPRLSGPCLPLSSRALVLAPCLLPMSLVCVCLCCAVTLLRHMPFFALPFRYAPGAAVAFLTLFLPMSELL